MRRHLGPPQGALAHLLEETSLGVATQARLWPKKIL